MAVGAVFAALSTAGNYWEKISSGSKIIHMGLWQTCGKPFTRSYCVDRSKTGNNVFEISMKSEFKFLYQLHPNDF